MVARRSALILVSVVIACDSVDENETVVSQSLTPAQVIINEILANEPGSNTGAEFVELVNVGGEAAQIDGWTLWDSFLKPRHVFAQGTILAGGHAVVVFGALNAIPPGVSNAVAASSGALSLNNTDDTVSLKDVAGTAVDSFTYGSALAGLDGVSMNRGPDGTP